MNPYGSQSNSGRRLFATELGCTLISLSLLFQLAFRSFVDQLGEWFARNSVILVLPILVNIGIVCNIALLHDALRGRIIRLCCWIAIGISYIDLKYVSDSISEVVFASSGGNVTDKGILTRGAFVALAASWIPVASIGFLLCSYTRTYFLRKKDAFLASVVLNILCSCAFLMLWVPEPPYPDCTIPLLGSLVSCMALFIELPKGIKLWGSIIIALGISYTFNSYLSCSYCGKVEFHNTGEQLHAIWKCPLRSGNILQVIEGNPDNMRDELNRSLVLRAMRLGHSIMGGVWIEPQSVYGVPIFSAFHLQAAGALFTNQEKENMDKKSLHIGLGVGTSLKVLQDIGYSCDCMEIHPEILAAAKEFFNLQGIACQIGDAGKNIYDMSLEKYDLINLDIFSGDTDMTLLKKDEFFRQISRSMMHSTDSVLVVNFFGLEGQQLKTLFSIMRESFVAVRVYREEQDEDEISNFVLIASNSDKLQNMDPVPLLDSEPYKNVFSDHKGRIEDALGRREILHLRDIRSHCTQYKSVMELFSFKACIWMENLRASGVQWRAFRRQFS